MIVVLVILIYTDRFLLFVQTVFVSRQRNENIKNMDARFEDHGYDL